MVAVAFLFAVHVALVAVVLQRVLEAERQRPIKTYTRTSMPTDRLLYVEQSPRRVMGRAPSTSPRRRSSAVPSRGEAALAEDGRRSTGELPAPAPGESAPTGAADATMLRSARPDPVGGAADGLRPALRDARVWAPPIAAPAIASPAGALERATARMLAPIAESISVARGLGRRALKDWTMTDARGLKWGLDSIGLRLGPRALAIQPPAPTDRERERAASSADIVRLRLMTPGDAEFERLKTELRRRREQSHTTATPPAKPPDS